MPLGRLIYSDYRRYLAMGNLSPLAAIFASQGLWATFVYRISHYLVINIKVPVLRRVVRLGCAVAGKVVEIITGICLSYDCEFGEGLHIMHFGNVFIGSNIGRNCNLSQGVTIGHGGHGRQFGVPTIGDRVFICPNAVIVGKITIGNDVVIGSGAFVSRSIPDRAVVIGNPARIVWYEGSFDLVRYDRMENDPERQASMSSRKSTAECDKSQKPMD